MKNKTLKKRIAILEIESYLKSWGYYTSKYDISRFSKLKNKEKIAEYTKRCNDFEETSKRNIDFINKIECILKEDI